MKGRRQEGEREEEREEGREKWVDRGGEGEREGDKERETESNEWVGHNDQTLKCLSIKTMNCIVKINKAKNSYVYVQYNF